MPKVNVPEILDLQAWLREQDPLDTADRQWRQEIYLCGTAMCAAGRAIVRAGIEPIHESSIYVPATPDEVYAIQYGDGEHDPIVMTISERAELLLGLTEVESAGLFAPGNNLPDMEYWISRILRRARHE